MDEQNESEGLSLSVETFEALKQFYQEQDDRDRQRNEVCIKSGPHIQVNLIHLTLQ